MSSNAYSSLSYNPTLPSGVGASLSGPDRIANNPLNWQNEDMVVSTGGGPQTIPGVTNTGWDPSQGPPAGMPMPLTERKDYSGISERQNVQLVLPFWPRTTKPSLCAYVFALNEILPNDITSYHITFQDLKKLLEDEDPTPFVRDGYSLSQRSATDSHTTVLHIAEERVLTVDYNRWFNELDDFLRRIMPCGPLKEGSGHKEVKTWGVRGDVMSVVHRAVTIKGLGMINSYWTARVHKGEQVGFLFYYGVTPWSVDRAKQFRDTKPNPDLEERRFPTTIPEIETNKLFREQLAVFFDPTVLQIKPITLTEFHELRDKRHCDIEEYYRKHFGMKESESIADLVRRKMDELTAYIYQEFPDNAEGVIECMQPLIQGLCDWHEARMQERCRYQYMAVGSVVNHGHFAPGMDGTMVAVDSFAYGHNVYDIAW